MPAPAADSSEPSNLSSATPSAAISFETPTRRRFTREEAGRSLTYVGAVVEDVQRQYGRILELRRAMSEAPALAAVGPNGDDSAESSGGDEPGSEPAYEAAMDRLGELVDELHAVGVELRDFERGLIAFPCNHADRTVLLSWKPGEDGIGFFHEQDESVAERRPLSELD